MYVSVESSSSGSVGEAVGAFVGAAVVGTPVGIDVGAGVEDSSVELGSMLGGLSVRKRSRTW